MRYEVHGKYEGEPVTVTWEDGEVGGDGVVCALWRGSADGRDGQYVRLTPYGSRTTHDHLHDPVSAYAILLDLLDPGGVKYVGNPLPLDDLPPRTCWCDPPTRPT